jgi:hypothetical protein
MISLLRGFLGYLLVAIKAGLATDPIERERVEFERQWVEKQRLL